MIKAWKNWIKGMGDRQEKDAVVRDWQVPLIILGLVVLATPCSANPLANSPHEPGPRPQATPLLNRSDFIPLPKTQCQGLQKLLAQKLKVRVSFAIGAFQDGIHQKSGTGCVLRATGTGRNFTSPATVIQEIGALFTELGWGEDPSYAAGGPTGMATAYRRSNNLAIVQAEWEPASEVKCPPDQPIADCAITPEQQRYRISLHLGQRQRSLR
ncbi:hypothetical protein K9N68_10615 [Kovacikia minuta CCNUW1]|uniref:hypothetical protein n=1 Tax=Kovacikia minuta TaxID=2931930 RepID=UPI001CCC6751|nr:hypothetical protein [Kovacikia minuta]UBF28286.1 hypothetical protein K9N68_10615 [Kovacikia minuta CCNUW1]